MFFKILAANREQLKKNFCEAQIIWKKILKEHKPLIIKNLIDLLGLNFVFCSEFVMSICWYFENVEKTGLEEDILDVTRFIKKIIKFYPRTPYLYFMLKKSLLYLSKHTFYNYDTDFSFLLDFLNEILKDFKSFFHEEQLKELHALADNLETHKNRYSLYKIINNLDTQFLLALDVCQDILNSKTSNKGLRAFALVLTIYILDSLDLTFLSKKYKENLKNNFADLPNFLTF